MTDVVQQLWGFCHILRHDGIDNGNYIEQITYLLFLKDGRRRKARRPESAACRDFLTGTDLARSPGPTEVPHPVMPEATGVK